MTEIAIWKAGARLPEPHWRTKPSKRSLKVVGDRLGPGAADAVARARVEWKPAEAVLSAAQRAPLPMEDPDVQRHVERVRDGRLLPPVVVDGMNNSLLDGEHRVSLVFHRNPNERVPVLTVPREREEPMAKSKKSQTRKSATRPSDVTEWREFGSPSDAVDEAVNGAHDRPDEEELDREYHRIKAAIPEMSDWQARVRAAQSAKPSAVSKRYRSAVSKRDHSVELLGEAVGQVREEAHRADLNAQQRLVLSKAAREAEQVYLRATRPWAAPTEEQVRKAADDDARIAKAERIREADPSISEYQALRRAAG